MTLYADSRVDARVVRQQSSPIRMSQKRKQGPSVKVIHLDSDGDEDAPALTTVSTTTISVPHSRPPHIQHHTFSLQDQTDESPFSPLDPTLYTYNFVQSRPDLFQELDFFESATSEGDDMGSDAPPDAPADVSPHPHKKRKKSEPQVSTLLVSLESLTYAT